MATAKRLQTSKEAPVQSSNRNAFLFLWNPQKDTASFADYERVQTDAKKGKPYETGWRCPSKRPKPGDIGFVQRTGPENNGVFARGTLLAAAKFGEDGVHRVRLRLDSFLPIGHEIRRESVSADWGARQSSGTIISDDILVPLERLFYAATRMGPLDPSKSAVRTPDFISLDDGSTPGRSVYEDFGPAPNDDPDELQAFARRVRRGQAKFRANLTRLYDGKCAISGWAPEEVLEAAHLIGHAGSGLNDIKNGILLRADLHVLFDAGLLRIDPEKHEVVLDASLKATNYWHLNGALLRLRTDGTQPGTNHLRARWATTSG